MLEIRTKGKEKNKTKQKSEEKENNALGNRRFPKAGIISDHVAGMIDRDPRGLILLCAGVG
jgi:hypothetical protein